jgi:hypothetical protein
MIQPDVEANRDALATLLEESIITRSQLERAVARLPTDKVFASPAAALHWMMSASDRVLLPHEVRIIRESAARDASCTSAASRVAIVAQAESLETAVNWPARRGSPNEMSGSLSPGSAFGWLAGATLVGAYAWHLFSASSPPACDDPDVSRTFGIAMLQAQSEAPSPDAMLDQARGAHTPSPKLVNPREVGYAKAARTRGCFASVKVDDTELPVAYVVRPHHGDRGGFVVAGAHREIVQARFTHIDADGNFSNTAAPVGRAAMEEAIRAGVDKFNLGAVANAGDAKFMMMQQLQRDRQPHAGRTDPEREREIADLEPNGPCRELVAGTRYTCNVMLERNDRLAAMLGATGTAVASADFTIERAGAGAPWRVADDFDAQYIEAIGRSRNAAIEDLSASMGEAAGTQK